MIYYNIDMLWKGVLKMDDLLKGVKIGKVLGKEEKKNDVVKIVTIVLAVAGIIAAIAGIAYAIYQKCSDNYYDDFEDDFDDLFDEDDDEDIFEE